jgi:catechol 2,3-dioxygenase-like lactoylglutathione lyase family enzyme
MTQGSSAKCTCKGINQVGIVVRDLELVAKNYWDILGIGPWAIYEWEAPLVYDRTYRGEKAWAREKIALVKVGDLELELVQPVDGQSIYHDWLREHGEGIHHMNFLTDDVDETRAVLANEGFPLIQSGKFGPPEEKGGYVYFDIKPLRAIWEPVHVGKEIGVEPRLFPSTTAESPAKCRCKGINQVAIAVNDLGLVAKNYWDILGIGPWAIYEWETPQVYDRTYRGEKVWAREKIALVQVGGVQLELVQPVDGPSIYRDWLEEHGEGIHHMNFLVDDLDEVSAVLTNEGFPLIQSGKVGPPAEKNAYAYFDIKPLRAIWEPVHAGRELGVEPRMFPS